LKLQEDFKSLKSIIDQTCVIDKEANDENELINEILSTTDILPQNFNLDCFSKVGIELLYYYRIGQFLDKILETIKIELSKNVDEIYFKNVITGLIKGSGIGNLFINDDGIFQSKNARNFCNKSRRVYKVYKCFPRPYAQIYSARRISADKLFKIKNDEVFENFVKRIKVVVEKNYDIYNYHSSSMQLFEDNFEVKTISNDIINDVLRYSKNPSNPIETQNTHRNPIFEKLKKYE
jgi:hypothetical protein